MKQRAKRRKNRKSKPVIRPIPNDLEVVALQAEAEARIAGII